VCVEQADDRLIIFEKVLKRITEEGGVVGMKSREEVYGPS